jgi:hypothetical protein
MSKSMIQSTLRDESPVVWLATTLALYACTSISLGVVYTAMGHLKLGKVFRFIPLVVLKGALAGVGFFLIASAFKTTTALDDFNFSSERSFLPFCTSFHRALSSFLMTFLRSFTFFLHVLMTFHHFLPSITSLHFLPSINFFLHFLPSLHFTSLPSFHHFLPSFTYFTSFTSLPSRHSFPSFRRFLSSFSKSFADLCHFFPVVQLSMAVVLGTILIVVNDHLASPPIFVAYLMTIIVVFNLLPVFGVATYEEMVADSWYLTRRSFASDASNPSHSSNHIRPIV